MNIKHLTTSKLIIPKMYKIKHIHLIGIGGIGMSGIAKVLVSQGYIVSGSDLVSNIITNELISLGVKIYFNHCSKNIINACVIVISAAIDINNPEIIAAHKKSIPIIKRAEMLAELMRFRYGIAIAGTHGKTTTTAMIIDIYTKAKLDPTFINGGLIKITGIHAKLGTSQYLIVEADESDASFLYLRPLTTIITNIEADHMDTYNGNFQELKQTFINFLNNLPFYGRAILCIDDPIIRSIIPYLNCYITTYGFSNDADVHIKLYQQKGNQSFFIIKQKNKIDLNFILNIPGRHNVLNATAAIASIDKNKINNNIILTALEQFKGISRRFDLLGNFSLTNINGKKNNIILIDDYGHHPTEINVTIKTARECWSNKRIIMIFQPHKYTRIRDLYHNFIKILNQVDILLILDVYPAGENPILGTDSFSLCQAISKKGKLNPIFINKKTQIYEILLQIINDNDLIITQGAGNIGDIAKDLVNKFTINSNKIR